MQIQRNKNYFNFFLPQEVELLETTAKATPKIEKICILHIYREYLLCVQCNSSGSFFKKCINFAEQRLKFSRFEGIITPYQSKNWLFFLKKTSSLTITFYHFDLSFLKVILKSIFYWLLPGKAYVVFFIILKQNDYPSPILRQSLNIINVFHNAKPYTR